MHYWQRIKVVHNALQQCRTQELGYLNILQIVKILDLVNILPLIKKFTKSRIACTNSFIFFSFYVLFRCRKCGYHLRTNLPPTWREFKTLEPFHEDCRQYSNIWKESDYLVFRKITENANAAMLNFNSPIYPEFSLKSFITYLHSFDTLFTDKCRKCGYHLRNNLPPTWREFKTLEPFHEDCR